MINTRWDCTYLRQKKKIEIEIAMELKNKNF